MDERKKPRRRRQSPEHGFLRWIKNSVFYIAYRCAVEGNWAPLADYFEKEWGIVIRAPVIYIVTIALAMWAGISIKGWIADKQTIEASAKLAEALDENRKIGKRELELANKVNILEASPNHPNWIYTNQMELQSVITNSLGKIMAKADRVKELPNGQQLDNFQLIGLPTNTTASLDTAYKNFLGSNFTAAFPAFKEAIELEEKSSAMLQGGVAFGRSLLPAVRNEMYYHGAMSAELVGQSEFATNWIKKSGPIIRTNDNAKLLYIEALLHCEKVREAKNNVVEALKVTKNREAYKGIARQFGIEVDEPKSTAKK